MIEKLISSHLLKIFEEKFQTKADIKFLQPTKTKAEFEGDFTVVVFPLLRFSNIKNPVELADFLGKELQKRLEIITKYNVVKGFLNLSISESFWTNFIIDYQLKEKTTTVSSEKIVIEFSSPNTNKPLHLGHIRNNLIGEALSNLLKFSGNDVTKVCLLNDRGIHIMKTLLAWEKFGNKITPEEAGKKGDHLIGDFYVKFDMELKKELERLQNQGLSKEEALQKSSLMNEAKELLRKWENGDEEIIKKWKLLNSWVEEGFNKTYEKLGVSFDKMYYESEIYKLGKEVILKELEKGTVKKNPDNSVSIDLTDAGLDEKILLRSDGTSVYITQDIGTAIKRYEEFKFDKHIYVVGNEQIYHFKVLKEILKRFGYDWSDKLIHYSYGMVELPEGKMKSREGKVVDADDLIEEMYNTARQKAEELGKLDGLSEGEKDNIIRKIAMGAMKYFILKVDPRKNMLFNPNESIDFEGNTGPFIQYSYTRIKSLIRKGEEKDIKPTNKVNTDINLLNKELELIKQVYNFENVINDSADNLNPASVANYVYQLAKSYNSYYQEVPILRSENKEVAGFRLKLSLSIAEIIKKSLSILGIEVPERM